MILMSKYKGQHGGKKGKQIRAMPERKVFSYVRCSLDPKNDMLKIMTWR